MGFESNEFSNNDFKSRMNLLNIFTCGAIENARTFKKSSHLDEAVEKHISKYKNLIQNANPEELDIYIEDMSQKIDAFKEENSPKADIYKEIFEKVLDNNPLE